MDTNNIKKFAVDARNKLKAGVEAKILKLGFTPKGEAEPDMVPQLLQGGAIWNGQTVSESFYHQWMSLQHRVQQVGIKDVYEEAAYTWFNRLVAIRILRRNNLIEPVLEYVGQSRMPKIVDDARTGTHLPEMSEQQRRHLMELLDDDTKVTEQFALLIVAWCHANPVINACFGSIADYTELLLPDNILSEGGFMDDLNHTDFITDEDFHSPELIGWLYQFYISERKDEVFAKKGKFAADEIAPATQIFTPNWIVKYMVQNTIGRIYLDNHPEAESEFKPKWKYLVDQPKTEAQNVCKVDELTDLRCGDLACGSGHILNECFDLLYDLYIYEGYTRQEAIENIFRRNLIGIDLDQRAKQLATFALLLKACQKDAGFLDGKLMPQVMTFPKVNRYTYEDTDGHFCTFYQLNTAEAKGEELRNAFLLMENGDSLGSIMRFNLSSGTRRFMQSAVKAYEEAPSHEDLFGPYVSALKVMLALTDQYDALVMNPPYMGSGNMNKVLNDYVKQNYVKGKADLFSTFMLVAINRLKDNGKYGMINMQSWMFLSSFESLRKDLLDHYHIDSMLHLGPHTFDELSGEVVQNTAYVLSKSAPNGGGTYFRLVDGKDCSDKERMFLEANQNHTDKIYYPNVEQSQFEKIPGCPIGYWVSSNIVKTFSQQTFQNYFTARHGILSGHDDSMFRLWFEVASNLIYFQATNSKAFRNSNLIYAPITKGGLYRKWYGDYDNVSKYNEETLLYMKRFPKFTLQSESYYFKEGLTWSLERHNGNLSIRYMPKGFLFAHRGPAIFSKNSEDVYKVLGFLTSKVCTYLFNIISPALSLSAGIFDKLPIIDLNKWDDNVVKENITISKQDWDAHETSWDFQGNELVSMDAEKYTDIYVEHYAKEGMAVDPAANKDITLEDRVKAFETEWTDKFMQLHDNEEELNRQFIDIYGLQDELTPDVPLDEVTILQQGEISIES